MSLKEGLVALKQGADMLGFVSEMPSGPGVIPLKSIANIIRQLPPKTMTVLLTSALTTEAVIVQHEVVKSWGVQLVDTLDLSELKRLRSSLPDVTFIQVIHVNGIFSIDTAETYAPYVDLLLLDSGKPNAPHKTLGGTGNVHDWKISREICKRSSIPVLLAGGLNVENISSALEGVCPDGVDLCSGVRSKGELDVQKLEAFTSALLDQSSGPSEHRE